MFLETTTNLHSVLAILTVPPTLLHRAIAQKTPVFLKYTDTWLCRHATFNTSQASNRNQPGVSTFQHVISTDARHPICWFTFSRYRCGHNKCWCSVSRPVCLVTNNFFVWNNIRLPTMKSFNPWFCGLGMNILIVMQIQPIFSRMHG